MIDERINNSLKELEQSLKSLDAARKQVEKTVNSYDALSVTTAEYVNNLGIVTTKVQELVDNIGNDYSLKVKAFEKDRETVVNVAKAVTKELSNATEEFKDLLIDVQIRLKYSLIINIVSLGVIGILACFLLK